MENSVNDQGKMCDRSIYPALVRFFDAYLARRDIPETLSLVTEDIYSLGTGESEVALNRKQFEMLLRQEMKAIPEPIRYRIEDYSQKQTGDHTWECFCRMETTVGLGQSKHVCYRTRLTAVFREEEGKILASALHMSEASRYQETEEFFPLRFASERAKGWSGSAQQELLEILCQIMPGGIVGGYLEEGFPLYVINDAMLQMTGYTYEEFVEATGGLVINSIYEEDAERVSDLVFRKMEEGKGR